MSGVSPLRLGMFVMPIHAMAKTLAQCIDEDLELAVQCEHFGFDDFWVGEHHSSSVENIVMPEIFLGKVLGLTERIRIGPAPVCLQYHHPAHVAGRLALLDHMSRGRLNVCFGPGAIPTDMEVYFMNDVIIAGDPAHVTAQLLDLREQIGPFGTLILTAHDWDDRNQWARSLELFAREVVPAFNKAIGAESSAPCQTRSAP